MIEKLSKYKDLETESQGCGALKQKLCLGSISDAIWSWSRL